jgi:hypothetical protein
VRGLGSHRLKDLDEPEPIYELVGAGLADVAEPEEAPPARMADRGPGAGFLGDFTQTLHDELRRHAMNPDEPDGDRDRTGESFGTTLSRRIFEDVHRALEERTRERADRRRERDPNG